MAEGKTKNLCAQIPEELHNKVSAERERGGQNLSQYVTWLITKFYEYEKGAVKMEAGETRTLAIQVPAELFDELDEYLAAHKLKKKAFLTDLIRKTLDEAKAAEAE